MKPARQAREAAGLTIHQAAKAARLSVSSMRKIEHGLPASYRVMQVLAGLYGCTDQPFRRHTEGGREMSTRKPPRRRAGAAARER